MFKSDHLEVFNENIGVFYEFYADLKLLILLTIFILLHRQQQKQILLKFLTILAEQQ